MAKSIENPSLLVQDLKKKLLRQDVICKGFIGRKLLWKLKGKRAEISRETVRHDAQVTGLTPERGRKEG